MSKLVILLHGIIRTKKSMMPLAKYLEKNGYTTLALTYPSRLPVEDIAQNIFNQIQVYLKENPTNEIYFIGHSMGGLIIRILLDKYIDKLQKVERVVMLGTPNHGSKVADAIGCLRLYKYIYGAAGQQLSTNFAKNYFDKIIFPKDIELGIIAGTAWYLDPFSHFIIFNAPSDARVSVESTKLDEMKDHITLPVTHSFMMYNQEVKKQSLNFLETGSFRPKS